MAMTLLDILILAGAAALAGGLNAVAGGGSFISLPALILTGTPPINANATSTVALWPGALASVGAYRKELTAQPRVLIILSIVSVLGGLLGALVLLHTPQETFSQMVPYLLLVATLLFASGSHISNWLRSHVNLSQTSWPALIAVSILQLPIAMYGGFFGGGLSILMLATLSLLGIENIHSMNAIKMLLNVFINGIAVATFVIAGIVAWQQALIMIGGAIAGGYGAARLARRLDPKLVRRFAILVGFVMTAVFFLRG